MVVSRADFCIVYAELSCSRADFCVVYAELSCSTSAVMVLRLRNKFQVIVPARQPGEPTSYRNTLRVVRSWN
jgi:hypothetical protein